METATDVRQLTTAELEAGLDYIRQAPRDAGVLELIVRRPAVDGREVLEEGELDLRGWHALAAMHTMAHRRQLQRIVAQQSKHSAA